VIDLDTNSTDLVDYPDHAEAPGQALNEKHATRSFLVCGAVVGASKLRTRSTIFAPHYAIIPIWRITHDDPYRFRSSEHLEGDP
jgi:hypothetical protein